MHDLRIEPLDIKQLSFYEGWFDQATVDMLLKQTKHLGLVNKDTHAWRGSVDGEVVTVALLSITEVYHGHLDFAVKPSERRHGIGAEMMSRMLVEPLVKKLSSLQVAVEPENTAGQKVLHNASFVQTGYSPEGLLEFRR